MKQMNVALGVIVLSGVLVIGCGGGEQNNANTASAPAPGASSQPLAGKVEVTLTTQPNPPRMGETTFEAMVMMGGQPVTDADVSVELFMAAMPAMNMPEMRNSVALTHAGGGRYRGTGSVMMAGSWDATVSVKRNGQDVGARKVPLVAK